MVNWRNAAAWKLTRWYGLMESWRHFLRRYWRSGSGFRWGQCPRPCYSRKFGYDQWGIRGSVILRGALAACILPYYNGQYVVIPSGTAGMDGGTTHCVKNSDRSSMVEGVLRRRTALLEFLASPEQLSNFFNYIKARTHVPYTTVSDRTPKEALASTQTR